jgi:hypothetical protein
MAVRSECWNMLRPLLAHDRQPHQQRRRQLERSQSVLDGQRVAAAVAQAGVDGIVFEDFAGFDRQAGGVDGALADQHIVERFVELVARQPLELFFAQRGALGHQLHAGVAVDVLVCGDGLLPRQRGHGLQIVVTFGVLAGARVSRHGILLARRRHLQS